MKGIVFTEFLDMVEDRFGANVVDDIIDDGNLASEGVYTSVGTYSHEEMVALVSALSNRSAIPVPELLKIFGQHLFLRFSHLHPRFFLEQKNALDFLSEIEDVIHAEVLKLYPDAQLPRFEVVYKDDTRLELLYRSSRHLEDLAEGLILGCFEYFKESIQCVRMQTSSSSSSESATRFLLSRT